MKYGKAIKIVRAMRGVSQSELALKASLDNSYISKIENEDRKPSLDSLEKITAALDIPIHLFILLASEKNLDNKENADALNKIRQLLLDIVISVL